MHLVLVVLLWGAGVDSECVDADPACLLLHLEMYQLQT